MESVQWGHPEDLSPFCVRTVRILDGKGALLAELTDNHETIVKIAFGRPLSLSALILELERPLETVPVSLFEVSIR